MKTKTIFKKTLTAVALAVAGAISTSASAALVFQIQEGAVGAPTAPNLVTLDTVGGQYVERVTFTGGNNFTAFGFFTAGGYFLGGASQGSQLNLPLFIGPNQGYSLYATFRSDGSFTPTGPGSTTFSGDPSKPQSLEIFIDRNQDTGKSFVGSNAAPTLTNTGDDSRVAFTTTLRSGLGRQDTTDNAAGNFELIFDNFTLEPGIGEAFFISPRPFHMVIDLQGNFNDFAIGAPGTFADTGGSANASFIPEPTTLALLGVSLLGLGFSTRRKKLS
ncbi:MAG: pepA [Bryobacterales bacterium]|nr:pepA [Bryobacterales bacterium]